MGNINSCGIILNLIQLFNISARIKKSLGDIVVKDIKSILLFKPRLLKKLKVSNRKLSKNRKTHFDITAIFNTYTPIIKTKNIKPYAESFTIRL